MQSLSKFQQHFLMEVGKSILKFTWNLKGVWIAKIVLQKSKVESLTLPDFRTYYKAIVIQIMSYWHQHRYISQWNNIESPEINSYVCIQMIFNKGAKSIQWGKNNFFNKWCQDNPMQRNEVDSYPMSCIKINSKWIKDLNIRAKSIMFCLRQKHRGKALWHWIPCWFFGYDTKNISNKRKIR